MAIVGLITTFLLTIIYTDWIITCIFVFFAICFSVYELICYIENGNRNFSAFLLSIRSADFTRYSTADKRGKSFEELKEAFNIIVDQFQVARTDKEAQYTFLQAVIRSLSTAIICFDNNGEIKLINDAANQLLNIPSHDNIRHLEKSKPELFERLQSGDNEVIELIIKDERLKLLFRSTTFILQGHEHKLVLITNIKSEIDKAETEAWQQLLQVLTHEIMNSITPISSLSDTVKGEFDKMVDKRSFDNEQLDDLSEALSVIKNRSLGLISFVHHYKSLINLPSPVFTVLYVAAIIEHVQLLTEGHLQKRGIRLAIVNTPHNLCIVADVQMVEQVILNLIYNAADALYDADNPCITLAAEERTDHITLTIADNGKGIDKEIQDKIFVPFFTTKTNGTGIGLSLSKQIMQLHKGNISAGSSSKTGTIFTLNFPKT